MGRGKIFFFFFSLILFFGCGLGQEPDLLLDSFEGEIDSNTVDFGASDNSYISAEASSKALCGTQSLKLSYRLNISGYMWTARGYKLDAEEAGRWQIKPEEISWENYKAVTLAMYGQNSGAIYAFDLKDSGGELWRYLIDDDFQGWKKIILPFDSFFSRSDWQPEDAEVTKNLDFPVYSYQFEPLVPGEKSVYFDCIGLTAALR